MMTTLVLIALFFAALLVGYFTGVHTARPTGIDVVSLKNLMEEYETAVVAYYANPGSLELAALKEARAHFAWWGLHD